MGVTITLGVRGSGPLVETASSEEPQERGTAFAELFSGGEFDPGSWSSDAGFDAGPSFESRAAPRPREDRSYAAREREEIEREAERDGAASTATPLGTSADAVDPLSRATTPERPRGADPGREQASASSHRVSREPARADGERPAAAADDGAAESGEGERPPETEPAPDGAPTRAARGAREGAGEPPKRVALANESASTPEPAAEASERTVEAEATEVAATQETSEAVDPSPVEAAPAEASDAAAGEPVDAEPDAGSSPAEADPVEAAVADGAEETAAAVLDAADEAAGAERETRTLRSTATSAPVLRASEIARVGEARPELALAPSAGATTTTTASDAALRVVETTASADVGGGGAHGSGGSGTAGQGDASAGARAALAVGAASAPATTARGAFPAASVFPEAGDAAPSWVERVAEKIRLARSSDRVELRLALVPKGLGQIDVRLRLDADGLHATIVAEHEQTRALLAGQQHRLEAALAQEDLNLSSFDLGVDDGGSQEEAPRGERREGGPGARAEGNAPESEEPPPAANVTSTVPGRLSFWA